MTETTIVQFRPPMREKQAAERLDVSIDTLQRIRKRGEIGYRKIGGRVCYTEDDLAAYLESVSVKPCLRNDSEKSPAIGFRSGPARGCGTQHGSIPGPDRQSALRLARTTFGKPN